MRAEGIGQGSYCCVCYRPRFSLKNLLEELLWFCLHLLFSPLPILYKLHSPETDKEKVSMKWSLDSYNIFMSTD